MLELGSARPLCPPYVSAGFLPSGFPPSPPHIHTQPNRGRAVSLRSMQTKEQSAPLPYSCGAQLPHGTRRGTKSVLLSSRQTLDLQTQKLSALAWGETGQSRGPAPHRLLNRSGVILSRTSHSGDTRQHSLIYRVSPRAGTRSPLTRRLVASPWLFGTRLGGQALGPCAAVGYQTSRARVPRSSFRLPGLTGPD